MTLITVGKMLEARSKGKTTDALKEPDETGAEDGHRSCRDGVEQEVPIDQVKRGDQSLWCARGKTSRWTA